MQVFEPENMPSEQISLANPLWLYDACGPHDFNTWMRPSQLYFLEHLLCAIYSKHCVQCLHDLALL